MLTMALLIRLLNERAPGGLITLNTDLAKWKQHLVEISPVTMITAQQTVRV